MKIGVDHLSINPSYKGGVSTYAFGLLDGLLAVNKNNIQYVVFIKSKDKSFYKEYLNNDKIVPVGVYLYFIEFKNGRGDFMRRQGHINLIR